MRYPIRFDHADDQAIRQELARHRPVMESKHGDAHTILCKCGASFEEATEAMALANYAEHWLAALKGSAA